MSWIEAIAAVFGVLSVFLSTKERSASWPTGIVNVALYAYVFFSAHLYASMGLQLVYFVLSLYGWFQWVRGSPDGSPRRLSHATSRMWIVGALLTIVGSLALGSSLARETNASVPYLDAMLTSVSLIAQWMLARKIVETWVLWIAVDLAYVPMYFSQQLYITAALYALFLALAVKGLREWQSRYRLLVVEVAP